MAHIHTSIIPASDFSFQTAKEVKPGNAYFLKTEIALTSIS
jgi:hypothetical protein